jgi:murein DD-endopeptidase MepM/ murein hydrolase activator NlpD
MLTRDLNNFGIRLAIAMVCLMAPGVLVLADNIYKYQDKDGIWHFTDREPEEGQSFETVFMQKEASPRIRMRREGSDRNPVYMLRNDFWGPVEVEVRLSDAVNVLTEPPLPARFVVPHQTEEAVVGFAALDPSMGFSYRLHLETVPGPPTPQAVNNSVLDVPFPAGEAYFISQGFNGTLTHNTDDSEYALDIVMPVGTQILAAKDGVVMDIEEDFNEGGDNKQKFVDKANHVRILHEDGTMAVYAHLDLASVIVRPGARVRAGQRIARSGNTGFSSGPHLHFALQQNIGLKLVSVPFRFNGSDGSAITPAEQELLKGTNPGQY